MFPSLRTLFPPAGPQHRALLPLVAAADPTVINRRVALLRGSKQQGAVGRCRDFITANTVAVLHSGSVHGAEGDKESGSLSWCLSVPAEGGVGSQASSPDGCGEVGGVQQGAVEGGVLSTSHLNGGCCHASCVRLKAFKTTTLEKRVQFVIVCLLKCCVI